MTVLLALAKIHIIELRYTQDEVVSLGLNVANETWNAKRILSWLQAHKIKNNFAKPLDWETGARVRPSPAPPN